MPRTPRRLFAAASDAAFDPVEAAAAMGIGVLALLTSGAIGLLLPALVDEGRLSASGIGLTAMIEALSTGLVTGGAGIVLKPVRLRTVAAIATAALVALDLATVRASGSGVLLVRAAAGAPEGILLWIAIGFIARTATPERWAAVLFTGMGVTQFALATLLTAWVLPHHGANGGYLALGAAAGLAFFLAPFLPASLGPVTAKGDAGGAPPLRGWVALAATLLMAASLMAVAVYVVPLARQAGLGATAGRSAVSVQLACNLAGGVIATAIAGRVRYLTVFWSCAAIFMTTWAVYATQAPAWLFIGMSGLASVAAYVASPFLVPMTIEADPSRRAAMQSGAVQLLAGALGPLLAAFSVTNRNVHGVLVLGAALQLAGLVVATLLHRSVRADQVRTAAAAAPA